MERVQGPATLQIAPGYVYAAHLDLFGRMRVHVREADSRVTLGERRSTKSIRWQVSERRAPGTQTCGPCFRELKRRLRARGIRDVESPAEDTT